MTRRTTSPLRLLLRCRPPGRVLSTALAWTVVQIAPAATVGVLLAAAVDAALAHRTLVAVSWAAGTGLAVAVAAFATWRSFGPLAATVETTRDRLTEAVVTGAVRRLASTGSPGRGALTQSTDEVHQVRGLLAALVRTVETTLVPLVAAAVGLTALDARLALAALVPVVLGSLLYAALAPATWRRFLLAAAAEEKLGDEVGAVATDAAALRGLRAGAWAAGHLATTAGEVAGADIRAARTSTGRHLVLLLGSQAPLLAVLLVAARGGFSPGVVVGAATYATAVLGPAVNALVSGTAGWTMQLLLVAQRLSLVADAPAPPVPGQPAGALPDGAVLRARGLRFAYGLESRPVLDGLDLCVRRGALVGVVGASGCGKSTTARILAGLLAPDAGTVELAPEIAITLIPQTPYVFPGTWAANLTYLCPAPVSPDRILAAAEAVGLGADLDPDEDVDPEALPAITRQRVVLARAMLCPSDVLVLDESMSLLDPADERRIEGLLRAGGRTLVVIAHRVDVARRADLVVHFDGAGVSVGRHDELLSHPAYAELHRPVAVGPARRETAALPTA